jgi:hypothetical protein
MAQENSPHRMQSVFEQIKDPEMQKAIRGMYPQTGDVQAKLQAKGTKDRDEWEGVVLLAFQHKLPDYVSTIVPMQQGFVHDENANAKVDKDKIPVKHCWIQPFTPVYKL